MSESQRHSRRRRHPLLIDRTPLFVGVVLIPLAASCVLGAGGLEIRTHSHRDAIPEMRALADRERREGEDVILEAERGEQDRHDDQLHGPVPPQFGDAEPEYSETAKPSPHGDPLSQELPALCTPSSGRAPPSVLS